MAVCGTVPLAMHAQPHRHSRLLPPFLAAAMVWVVLSGAGLGQQPAFPPPGEDGIVDETRALSAPARRQLAEELRQFRADLKCEAWVTATSFTTAGISVRRQAQMNRRAWDRGQPAVLMAYDRASNSSGLSFSSQFWQNYSAAELVEIMQEASRLLADDKVALEDRMLLATRSWMDRLRAFETVRLRQTLLLQRDEKRLAATTTVSLGCLALAGVVLGLLSRRRSDSAQEQFFLPEVQVAARFGAPYGGGVTAELRDGTGA